MVFSSEPDWIRTLIFNFKQDPDQDLKILPKQCNKRIRQPDFSGFLFDKQGKFRIRIAGAEPDSDSKKAESAQLLLPLELYGIRILGLESGRIMCFLK